MTDHMLDLPNLSMYIQYCIVCPFVLSINISHFSHCWLCTGATGLVFDLAIAVLLQEAFGKTWVLYDMGILAAMLICLITYSVYIQSLVDFQPVDTYEVYDSLGGAQARLLLPKKKEPTTYNGQHSPFAL